ncbi:MAG: bifunctional folylpolyglutamate synthase/dihydrofolate synthase [Spirochaetaceae bacterium]|nr:MAG: bifunctional folylpolyglutamate synthase/dihydrofolate synthase [Spirochaetaceae bacterium]
MIASVEAGFAWFESFTNLEKQPGGVHREYRLDRMRELLSAFGNPHHATPAIHVAGSKGKGSTCAFIQSVLTAAGFRVGGYYSPHVRSYRERYRIDPAPDDRLVLELMRDIEEHVRARMHGRARSGADGDADGSAGGEKGDGFSGEPTTFELLTLLAFLLFRRVGLDWVVLETGLGGRLDATNVVLPVASVITPIELEHTEYLGTTIAAIAGEKAGIIKPGKPVFISAQRPEAHAVFVEHAVRAGAPLWDFTDSVLDLSWHEGGCAFCIDGVRFAAPLRLIGRHQAANAALAAAVVRRLLPDLPPPVIERGLSDAWIPGRLEQRENGPRFFLDGAHTTDSVRAVADAFAEVSTSPRILLFGVSQGKDPLPMARVLAPLFETVVVTRAGTFKPADPTTTAAAFANLNVPCTRLDDPAEAVDHCRFLAGMSGSVLVTGSFYLVGTVASVLDDGGQPRSAGV